ncbi:MAG: hypothetical protein GX799_01060 [Crenarchaeota archaeon]|nr:hypothetical protein [Thermoproteota archaeon]
MQKPDKQSNIYFFNHKTGVSGQVNSKKGAKVKNVLAIIVVITLNVLIHFAVQLGSLSNNDDSVKLDYLVKTPRN